MTCSGNLDRKMIMLSIHLDNLVVLGDKDDTSAQAV